MTTSVFRPRCKAQLSITLDDRRVDNTDKDAAQRKARRSVLVEVTPKSANVSLNGYHEGATWNMEFDARSLPFDPDQVTSVAAWIYMWDSGGDDTVEWATPDKLMLEGITDDADGVLIGDSNMVKLVGRDYTSVLDLEWNPKDNVEVGDALDVVVQRIADKAAPVGTRARFTVKWEADEDPPRSGGLHRSTKKKGLWIKQGKTYWEVIYDLVTQHGFIVYVRGRDIVVTDPKTQTAQSLATAPRLAYGVHLTRLRVKRKFARERVPQVVLVAWDPDTGQEIQVEYPEKRNVIVDGLAVKKDERMYFPAPKGIIDRDTLKRYARMRFYHLGRGESTYDIETAMLSVEAGAPSNDQLATASATVDLLRLRTGDPIGIKFDPFNREHLRKLTTEMRVAHLEALGYAPSIAEFVAANVEQLTQYTQPYYSNKLKFDYDEDEGITIAVTAVNFASQLREIHYADASDAGRPQ